MILSACWAEINISEFTLNNKIMRLFTKKLIYTLILASSLHAAHAAEEFVIEDIRLEGIERITAGTVFNYLPMKVGDTFDYSHSSEAVRALFKTGFFEDVRLERDGNVLVFIFKERPAIGSITVEGNTDIDTDELLQSLSQVDFAEGRVFVPAQLDRVERELQRQYFSLGKYAAEINTSVSPLDDNRVAVLIDIVEGEGARVRQINIVGNRVFAEEELLDKFELSAPTLFSFLNQKDQYSRQKLSGDLESLKSHYLEHGYLNFSIDSTQVSITPDKKDIYVTINISEGEQYTISEIKFGGELILPEEELSGLVTINAGELFSRKKLTESTEKLTKRLGDKGYAFANINTIPEIDKENKTALLTFFIDPGKRVYVRRISFAGNSSTRDEVLRREMRQQESAWISASNIETGKLRLQRLGYFKDVNVETLEVPGTADQVDVNYVVEETPSGNLNLGLGFSQEQGFVLRTSISQNNFLGSGKRIAFSFSNSDTNQVFQLGYTNPYFTVDGISIGYNLSSKKTDAFESNITAFNLQEHGGDVHFGIPVSENNTLLAALDYVNVDIDSNSNSSRQVTDFITENGGRHDIVSFVGSFRYDGRNKAIFPDSGSLLRVRSKITIPGVSDTLEFYKLDLRSRWYKQLGGEYVLVLKGELGLGDGLGDTADLPFFENFYSGGPRTVRGYRANTLGPIDSANRPIGGSLKVVGGTELVLPVPFLKDLDSVRISGFFDIGNVFEDLSGFDSGELRYSAGLGGIWISPFGRVNVSIAKPIGDEPGDDLEQFQFTFGTSF